jgi:ERCC4-type nuclease
MDEEVRMKILIDTREQTPWYFDEFEVETEVRGLKTGDYSVDGYEEKICVERKSVSDLVGTITRGRDRFQRELGRMQEMDFAAVVIEADWAEVIRWCLTHTEMNPKSLNNSMLTFQMRFPRCHWVFRPTRYTAMKTTYQIFDLYLRRILNVK